MKTIDKLMGRSAKYADRVHFTVGEKPKTNADRIRAMTDEELAVLLANTEANFPPNFPNGVSVKLCTTSWLDWLKKDADYAKPNDPPTKTEWMPWRVET